VFYGQRRWRQDSRKLKGDDRKASLERHERMGDRITVATLCVVALAFGSNGARGLIDANDATSFLLPGHFHGWAGLLGLILMLVLWRLGRRTHDARVSSEPFARQRELHGKFSDLMALLVVIHAFLGFLYLLTIL
jgi:hypothetical protein